MTDDGQCLQPTQKKRVFRRDLNEERLKRHPDWGWDVIPSTGDDTEKGMEMRVGGRGGLRQNKERHNRR